MSAFHPKNTAPAGFREITEEEFAKSRFFIYGPKEAPEYRQMRGTEEGEEFPKMLSAYLYHMFDGTGFAMSSDYWAGKIRYFAFGCDHKYVGLSPAQSALEGIKHYGMHCHVSKCVKCGHVHQVDSSG